MRGYGRYGQQSLLRQGPSYGYGPPPTIWNGGKGKGKGKGQGERFLADGDSAPSPPLVYCFCGNYIKASILRKRPSVLCNCCGAAFPLDGIEPLPRDTRVSQSVSDPPWRNAAGLARVRTAPGVAAAANVEPAAMVDCAKAKMDLQAELDGVLRFIVQVEQKLVPSPDLLANLRAEEVAIKERIAAVPIPVPDRSALTRKLNALTGAVATAENEKKQQMASFDRELAALNDRIEKIAKAEQVLAKAELEFAEVQKQLAVASPPPGSVPLFATVQQLQEYLVKNPAVVSPCFGDASFLAHFAAPSTPGPTSGIGVKEEFVGAKRSVGQAFGVVDVVSDVDDNVRAEDDAGAVAPSSPVVNDAFSAAAPMEADRGSGQLTPRAASEDGHGRSRSPVPLHARPRLSSFDASEDAKRLLAETLAARP